MQRHVFSCKFSGTDIKESLILFEVCSHDPGNLGIGGVTLHLWVDSSPSCSPVQARLERDGKIQRRGEQAGRWKANHTLRSAHFCISCKDLANACSSRNQDKQRCTQWKKNLVGMTPLNTLRCVVWHCCLPAATTGKQMSHIWVVIYPTHSRPCWTNLWFLPASVTCFSIVTWEDMLQTVSCLTCTLAGVTGWFERLYPHFKRSPVLGFLSSSWRCCV